MLQLFLENRATIQKALVALLFLLAMWRGKGPERASGTVLAGMLLVHLVFREFLNLDSVYGTLDPVNFLIDTGGLAGFLWIAMRANRFYPLVLAAAQLVAFMAHIVRLLVEPISSLAYYLLAAMPFWFQIFILASGIAHHIYRTSFLGNYSDWRLSPPRPPRTSYS